MKRAPSNSGVADSRVRIPARRRASFSRCLSQWTPMRTNSSLLRAVKASSPALGCTRHAHDAGQITIEDRQLALVVHSDEEQLAGLVGGEGQACCAASQLRNRREAWNSVVGVVVGIRTSRRAPTGQFVSSRCGGYWDGCDKLSLPPY